MPVTESAKMVIRQLKMNEITKVASMCLKKWLLVRANTWINREDRICYTILQKGPDNRYSDFGHIQWCGQLGYTLHAPRLNGIPIDDLKEIMAQIEEPWWMK